MKSIIFNGRDFAKKKEEDLGFKINDLRIRNYNLKLSTILVGDNPASILYTNLKKKAGDRVGIDVEIINFPKDSSFDEIKSKIKSLNEDNLVNGIMIQLPLPEGLRLKAKSLINLINPMKDVDGLRVNSRFIHPTAMAVMEILNQAMLDLGFKINDLRILIVGSEGVVGKALVKELLNKKLNVFGIDKKNNLTIEQFSNFDVLISAVGVPNLIKGNMVKEGVIVIDVGSPKGDVDPIVAEKAAFLTPVPGGVGPVTIMCLLENVLKTVN